MYGRKFNDYYTILARYTIPHSDDSYVSEKVSVRVVIRKHIKYHTDEIVFYYEDPIIY
jgi:hypothetical protein